MFDLWRRTLWFAARLFIISRTFHLLPLLLLSFGCILLPQKIRENASAPRITLLAFER